MNIRLKRILPRGYAKGILDHLTLLFNPVQVHRYDAPKQLYTKGA